MKGCIFLSSYHVRVHSDERITECVGIKQARIVRCLGVATLFSRIFFHSLLCTLSARLLSTMRGFHVHSPCGRRRKRPITECAGIWFFASVL